MCLFNRVIDPDSILYRGVNGSGSDWIHATSETRSETEPYKKFEYESGSSLNLFFLIGFGFEPMKKFIFSLDSLFLYIKTSFVAHANERECKKRQ